MIATVAAIDLLAAVPAGAQISATDDCRDDGLRHHRSRKARCHPSADRLNRTDYHQEAGTVGTTVPETLELRSIPEAIISDIPSVKGYRYFVYKDDVLLVDPQTRKVVTIDE